MVDNGVRCLRNHGKGNFKSIRQTVAMWAKVFLDDSAEYEFEWDVEAEIVAFFWCWVRNQIYEVALQKIVYNPIYVLVDAQSVYEIGRAFWSNCLVLWLLKNLSMAPIDWSRVTSMARVKVYVKMPWMMNWSRPCCICSLIWIKIPEK